MFRYFFVGAAALTTLLLAHCSSYEPHARELRDGVLLGAAPAHRVRAAEPTASPAVPIRRVSAPSLAPSYRNAALLNAEGERRIRIRLASQSGELMIGNQVALRFPVCSGRQNSTPIGSYRILEKNVKHRSNLYHVSMPYFMRLTYDGIGLHVGELYPYPVSHGCVRMRAEDCIPLYRAVSVGTPVELLP